MPSSASRAAWCGLLLLPALALAGCNKKDPAPAPGGDPSPAGAGVGADVTDGTVLFASYCAPCHGEKGDGDGVVKLDRPARSFVKGGFSFGNTPEALMRTITNGIGGTPMPGFGETLTENQREALVQRVIELGPPQEAAPAPGQTEIVVHDRARVARGGLPPIAEGEAPVVRGLLVGNPDGLTWQYNADPLELLGVRQGKFVDRKDWSSRGGDALEPLGQVMFVLPKEAWGWVDEQGNAAEVILSAVSTEPGLKLGLGGYATEENNGVVSYTLRRADGELVNVRERGGAATIGGLTGFRRTMELKPDRSGLHPRPGGRALDGFPGTCHYFEGKPGSAPWIRLERPLGIVGTGWRIGTITTTWICLTGDPQTDLETLRKELAQ
ncbi:MAG: cytochrome c [Planctomycetota bacterium]